MENILHMFDKQFERVRLLGDILVAKVNKKYLDFELQSDMGDQNRVSWYKLRTFYIAKGRCNFNDFQMSFFIEVAWCKIP